MSHLAVCLFSRLVDSIRLLAFLRSQYDAKFEITESWLSQVGAGAGEAGVGRLGRGWGMDGTWLMDSLFHSVFLLTSLFLGFVSCIFFWADPSAGDASSAGSLGLLSSEEATEHCNLPRGGGGQAAKNQETIRSCRTGPLFSLSFSGVLTFS